jgi:adenosylcobinamide-GDP ribazoletransferase
MFFTRLPLWRLKVLRAPAESYKRVMLYWATTGWLTAGVMSGVLWLSAQALPYDVAVVLAILARLLLTGALHEDGLADFTDGFGGGGGDRERTLDIMKDSHTGVYGVIGLIIYFLLLYLLLSHLGMTTACLAILMADPLCKFIASLITWFLPYARTAETSKSGVVYDRMSVTTFIIPAVSGLLPLTFMPDVGWLTAIPFPLVTAGALLLMMKRRIGGYTGDCCGALFLMCELSFYIGIVVILT